MQQTDTVLDRREHAFTFVDFMFCRSSDSAIRQKTCYLRNGRESTWKPKFKNRLVPLTVAPGLVLPLLLATLLPHNRQAVSIRRLLPKKLLWSRSLSCSKLNLSQSSKVLMTTFKFLKQRVSSSQWFRSFLPFCFSQSFQTMVHLSPWGQALVGHSLLFQFISYLLLQTFITSLQSLSRLLLSSRLQLSAWRPQCILIQKA